MSKTLHIYNPEHDIALACNQWKFSIPKAARTTRERFWKVPLEWAKEGDMLLVPDWINKEHEYEKGVRLLTLSELGNLTPNELPERIEPWGWDRLIVNQLSEANKALIRLCPDDGKLQLIREMSARRFAAESILPQIVEHDSRNLVGEALAIDNFSFLISHFSLLTNSVLKSPWSCSGRGVRFIKDRLEEADERWAEKIIKEQGCVMLEPQYNKVVDFAMEFYATKSGVEYCGLNVFETRNGKYLGNLGRTEEDKLQHLIQHIDESLLWNVRDRIIEITGRLFRDRYTGPFGIDMMVVEHEGRKKVHPCVEMNLRRTMGQITLP